MHVGGRIMFFSSSYENRASFRVHSSFYIEGRGRPRRTLQRMNSASRASDFGLDLPCENVDFLDTGGRFLRGASARASLTTLLIRD